MNIHFGKAVYNGNNQDLKVALAKQAPVFTTLESGLGLRDCTFVETEDEIKFSWVGPKGQEVTAGSVRRGTDPEDVVQASIISGINASKGLVDKAYQHIEHLQGQLDSLAAIINELFPK